MLIMHQRIGLSAGIVSISRMPGHIVEKIEVGLQKLNYDAVETLSINIKSVENVQRDWRPTVVVVVGIITTVTLNIKQRNGR